MRSTLSTLLERLVDPSISSTNVIPWGSPVPSFGDLSQSKVATLGLNPSNREFVDIQGKELVGELRRFHTLKSLGLSQWSDANEEHHQLIVDSCRKYFFRNPYDGWFRSLDTLISGTGTSYYGRSNKACHLDLIPFATACKWTDLSIPQRTLLLDIAGDTLGMLLRQSPVRLLVLNGKAVVENLQLISSVSLDKEAIPAWTLPRKSGLGVKGYAYTGVVRELSGVKLKRDIRVLGFNHNIQSSFGVTTHVKSSIRNWVTHAAKEAVQ